MKSQSNDRSYTWPGETKEAQDRVMNLGKGLQGKRELDQGGKERREILLEKSTWFIIYARMKMSKNNITSTIFKQQSPCP